MEKNKDLLKIDTSKKMAEGKLRIRKHSTVRPQGGQVNSSKAL